MKKNVGLLLFPLLALVSYLSMSHSIRFNYLYDHTTLFVSYHSNSISKNSLADLKVVRLTKPPLKEYKMDWEMFSDSSQHVFNCLFGFVKAMEAASGYP